MEGTSSSSSSSSPGSNPAAAGGGASSFLANLPSRGFLSSAILSSNPNSTLGGMRVYICEHDSSPPDGQVIKTNQTNILIRSLQLKNQKGGSSSKDVKGTTTTESSRKRPVEKALEGRTAAKRSNTQNGSRQEGSDACIFDKDLYSLTVERLRAILKERGLSPKGKKDELVARLRSVNG